MNSVRDSHRTRRSKSTQPQGSATIPMPKKKTLLHKLTHGKVTAGAAAILEGRAPVPMRESLPPGMGVERRVKRAANAQEMEACTPRRTQPIPDPAFATISSETPSP